MDEVVLNLIERDLNHLDPRNLFILTNNVTKNLGNLQNHSFRFDDEVVEKTSFWKSVRNFGAMEIKVTL